jgi:hypothetical protein
MDLTKSTHAATSRAKQPASIDVLFARLLSQYGKHWLDMWEGVPMSLVKAEWAQRLAGVKPAAMEAALDHLGKFPPTLPEMKDLCEQFRRVGPPQLAIVDARREPMPQKVRDQLDTFLRKSRMP